MKIQEEAPNELELAKELIIIWRSYTGDYIPIPRNNDDLSSHRKLLLFFKEHFDSSVEKWAKFVSLVTRSKFLMGKVTSFRASLGWVLQEQKLARINEGYYHSSYERAAGKRRVEFGRNQKNTFKERAMNQSERVAMT